MSVGVCQGQHRPRRTTGNRSTRDRSPAVLRGWIPHFARVRVKQRSVGADDGARLLVEFTSASGTERPVGLTCTAVKNVLLMGNA